MAVVFASGAQLSEDGQTVIEMPETPPPASAEPNPAPAPPDPSPLAPEGEPAPDETEPPAPPAPDGEPEPAPDEGPHDRAYVARTIRRNERLQRETEAQRHQIEYLTQQLRQGAQPVQGHPPPPPQQPSPPQPLSIPRVEQYATYEEHAQAMQQYVNQVAAQAAQQAIQQDRQRYEEARQQAEQAQRQQAIQQKEYAARQRYDDYDDAVQTLQIHRNVAPVLNQAFVESPLGADLVYHLSTHPEDAQQLNGLSPWAATKWLATLEDRLTTQRQRTPPRGRQALGMPPPPITPPGGGTAPVNPGTPDHWGGDQRKYEAWYRAQQDRAG